MNGINILFVIPRKLHEYFTAWLFYKWSNAVNMLVSCILLHVHSSPHLPITPVQLMRLGIGRNASCKVGEFASRSFFFIFRGDVVYWLFIDTFTVQMTGMMVHVCVQQYMLWHLLRHVFFNTHWYAEWSECFVYCVSKLQCFIALAMVLESTKRSVLNLLLYVHMSSFENTYKYRIKERFWVFIATVSVPVTQER